MAQLREHVARRVAEAELRDVERIGAAPVQSVLTDDATNVSMLFFALPNLVMHGSIVFGCLGYLAWLSWPVCLLAASYEEVVQVAEELTSGLSSAERDLVFGGTAERVYLGAK